MTSRTLVGLGIGWGCAAIALFFTKVYGVDEPSATVICFLAGLSSTLVALNVGRE